VPLDTSFGHFGDDDSVKALNEGGLVSHAYCIALNLTRLTSPYYSD